MLRLGLELTKACPVRSDIAFDALFGRHRLRENLTCGQTERISYYHCDNRPGGQIEVQADTATKPFYFRGEFVRIVRPNIVVLLCTFRKNWRPTYRVQINFEPMRDESQIRVSCDDTGLDARDLREFWKTRLDYLVRQMPNTTPRASKPIPV